MNRLFKKKEIEETKEIKTVQPIENKPKKKVNVFTIVLCCFIVLAHIAFVVAVFNSYQYYAIYPSVFGSIVAIVTCILIITDIIFFVGFNHKDLALKVVTLILAVSIFAGGTVGTYLLMKVNGSLGNIINNGEAKYETVSGVFTYMNKDLELISLEDIDGLSIGFVSESTRGIATIAKEKLDELKINYAPIEYNNNIELLLHLADGSVGVAVFPNGYQGLFTGDENNDYSSYLTNMNDFYTFEEQVKVDQKISKKNLSKEPFNILLIGWSRTDIGSTVGLADAIMVATINPQTYTISLMSIARDSYVDIPCYGNTKDKINSGRSTSRACFIDTVEQLVGKEMDFYMELDYYAIAIGINVIGGITIENPVEFELDGQYMPAGRYLADGYQVLQFVRERHHMPNGDFDRQQHQKEVIMEVAKKLIRSKDITLALNAFDAASDYISTDMSLKQITELFNLILNTKNYTGLDTFDLLDFQTSRMTGYASWHYSYDYGFPLWIYKLYDGSIKECLEHMNEILGEVDITKQKYSFVFDANNPYVRPPFSSMEFDEKEDHEQMPPFFPHLDTMTYQEVVEWAAANGVSLEVDYIYPGDANYNEALDGMVVDQSVRYGSLLSEYKSVKITVMGVVDEGKLIPNFVGRSLSKVYSWAEDHYYKVKIDDWELADKAEDVGRIITQDIKPGTVIDEEGGIIHITVYDTIISNYELEKLVKKTEEQKGTKYKDVMEWVKRNLYYEIETNDEVGELISYKCEDEKLKYSSRGCKFNFSDGKKTEEKDYSKLTEAEKALVEYEYTDGEEDKVGACSLLYINDELESVTCKATRKKCGEHEERDSNGACQFKPYSYTSSSCEGIENPTTENIGPTDGTLISTTYEITYSSKDVAACKITYTYQENEQPVDPPPEETTE